jgi:nitroreductase
MHVTLTAVELAAHDTAAAAGTFVLGVVSLGLGWNWVDRQNDPVGFLVLLLGGLLIVGALA